MIKSPNLAIFIVGVVGLGLLIGYLTAPGDWYASLQKPWFNPPNWVFAPVWTVLYVLIAIVGWRIWNLPDVHELKTLWSVQMLLNFLWSPAFFGAQSPGLGLMVILPLLATIVIFIAKIRHIDPASSTMFIPYAAWVAFASLLNASIYAMN